MADKKEPDSNIIAFPREKLRNSANLQSQEDYLQMIEEYKNDFADELTDLLSSYVFGELGRGGIDFSSQIDDLFPSMLLVAESIRSLQLKASKVHHPLQDFAEEAFEENEVVDKHSKFNYDNTIDEDFD